MDEQRLAEIEARANAATPGPWERESETVFSVIGAPMIENNDGTWTYRRPVQTYGRRLLEDICVEEHWACATEADADFLTQAREDVPALVAEVRRLRDGLQRTEALLIADVGAFRCQCSSEHAPFNVEQAVVHIRRSLGQPT